MDNILKNLKNTQKILLQAKNIPIILQEIETLLSKYTSQETIEKSLELLSKEELNIIDTYKSSFLEEKKKIEEFEVRIVDSVSPMFTDSLLKKNLETSRKYIKIMGTRIDILYQEYMKKRCETKVNLRTYYDDLNLLVRQEKSFLNQIFPSEFEALEKLLIYSLENNDIYSQLSNCSTLEILENFNKAKDFETQFPTLKKYIFAPFDKVIKSDYIRIEMNSLSDKMKEFVKLEIDSIQDVFKLFDNSLEQWISMSDQNTIIYIYEQLLDEYSKSIHQLIIQSLLVKTSTNKSQFDRDWTNVENAIKYYQIITFLFKRLGQFEIKINDIFNLKDFKISSKNTNFLKEHVDKHVNDALFQNIEQQLKGFSFFKIWSEVKESKYEPITFTLPPQQYMSQITEYLVTLLSHIDINDDTDDATYWTGIICKRTVSTIIKLIQDIPRLKQDGTYQLIADLKQLDIILDHLGHKQDDLSFMIDRLSLNEEEYSKIEIPKGQELIHKKIGEIRGFKK